MIKGSCIIVFVCCTLLISVPLVSKEQTKQTEILIIGGTTSGISAGLQSARLDVSTLIVEETPWLGGMLTAAGVSATDGNHR